MKHKSKLLINFIFLLAIFLFGVYAIKSNSTSEARQKCTKELETISASDSLPTELHLLRMLDKKDFFRLETLLQEKRSELSPYITLYLEANLQNAFNQTEQSLQTIDKLLGNYSKSLDDALLHRVFVIKYDNLFKQYRYRQAAEALKIAIDKYGHVVDSAWLGMLREEYYGFVKAVKEFPAQKKCI